MDLEMSPRIRKFIPYGAALLLAAGVVIASNAGLAPGATYALAGFSAGVLVVGGTLFAFAFVTGELVNEVNGVTCFEGISVSQDPPEVSRHRFHSDGSVEPSPHGPWVPYQEHRAAMEAVAKRELAFRKLWRSERSKAQAR
jgi:hypothetical protein